MPARVTKSTIPPTSPLGVPVTSVTAKTEAVAVELSKPSSAKIGPNSIAKLPAQRPFLQPKPIKGKSISSPVPLAKLRAKDSVFVLLIDKARLGKAAANRGISTDSAMAILLGKHQSGSAAGVTKEDLARFQQAVIDSNPSKTILNVMIGLLGLILSLVIYLLTKTLEFTKSSENVAVKTSTNEAFVSDLKKSLDKINDTLASLNTNISVLSTSFNLHKADTADMKSDLKQLLRAK